MLKNIQKITAILLVALLTLSLAACGGEKPAATQSPVGTTVAQNAPTTAASTAAATTAAPTAVATTAAPTAVATTAAPTAVATTAAPTAVATTAAPTVPATTVPATTVPATTVPATTVPATTAPSVTTAPVVNEFFNPNNNILSAGQLTITPRHVRYKNGEIIAECFINNGTAQTITAFKVKSLILADSNKQAICDATFPDVVYTSIAPNSSIIHTFRFSGETVLNPNAQLSSLSYASSVEYTSV